MCIRDWNRHPTDAYIVIIHGNRESEDVLDLECTFSFLALTMLLGSIEKGSDLLLHSTGDSRCVR